jgi:hypothetical protein
VSERTPLERALDVDTSTVPRKLRRGNQVGELSAE